VSRYPATVSQRTGRARASRTVVIIIAVSHRCSRLPRRSLLHGIDRAPMIPRTDRSDNSPSVRETRSWQRNERDRDPRPSRAFRHARCRAVNSDKNPRRARIERERSGYAMPGIWLFHSLWIEHCLCPTIKHVARSTRDKACWSERRFWMRECPLTIARVAPTGMHYGCFVRNDKKFDIQDIRTNHVRNHIGIIISRS